MCARAHARVCVFYRTVLIKIITILFYVKKCHDYPQCIKKDLMQFISNIKFMLKYLYFRDYRVLIQCISPLVNNF